MRGLAILIGGLLLSTGRAAAQERADIPEYEVKSAYLFNFLQYTSWPPDALDAAGDLTLCILGDDPMGDLLPRAIGRRRIDGHTIRIVSVSRPVEAGRCHAAFIAGRNATSSATWLGSLRGKPVLTVGEGPEFAAEGGMIALVLETGTVRFEVNARALRQANLQLSSRVMRLARAVRDE